MISYCINCLCVKIEMYVNLIQSENTLNLTYKNVTIYILEYTWQEVERVKSITVHISSSNILKMIVYIGRQVSEPTGNHVVRSSARCVSSLIMVFSSYVTGISMCLYITEDDN